MFLASVALSGGHEGAANARLGSEKQIPHIDFAGCTYSPHPRPCGERTEFGDDSAVRGNRGGKASGPATNGTRTRARREDPSYSKANGTELGSVCAFGDVRR